MNRFEFLEIYEQKVKENNENLVEVMKEFISDMIFVKMKKQEKDGWKKTENQHLEELLKEKENDKNLSFDSNPAIFMWEKSYSIDGKMGYLNQATEVVYKAMMEKNKDKLKIKSKKDFKEAFAYIFYDIKYHDFRFLTNDLIIQESTELNKNKYKEIFENHNLFLYQGNLIRTKNYNLNKQDEEILQQFQYFDNFIIGELEEGFKNQSIKDKIEKVKMVLKEGTSLNFDEYSKKFDQFYDEKNEKILFINEEYNASFVLKRLNPKQYAKEFFDFVKKEVQLKKEQDQDFNIENKIDEKLKEGSLKLKNSL